MIKCTIEKREDVYYVLASKEDRTVTIAVKQTEQEAKDLAIELHSIGYVHILELESVTIL